LKTTFPWSENGAVLGAGVIGTAVHVDVNAAHTPGAGPVVPHAGVPVCLHVATQCAVAVFAQ
jgi:hypothetical protein